MEAIYGTTYDLAIKLELKQGKKADDIYGGGTEFTAAVEQIREKLFRENPTSEGEPEAGEAPDAYTTMDLEASVVFTIKKRGSEETEKVHMSKLDDKHGRPLSQFIIR